MPGAVEHVLVELGEFFDPLAEAIEGPHELAVLMRRLGYDLEGDALGGARAALGPLGTGIRELADLAIDAVDGGFDESDVVALAAAAAPVFADVKSIASPFSGLNPEGLSPSAFAAALGELPEDILNLLLADYLLARVPLALHILGLVEAYRVESIPATGHPRSRGLDHIRHVFDWAKLGQLIRDPEGWARDTYGWGVDFDHETVILRVARAVTYLGGVAELRDMSDAQIALFMPHLVDEPGGPQIALAPLYSKQTTNADGDFDVSASAEAGIGLLPVAGNGAAVRSDAGLAIGPYAEGTLSASTQISPSLTLNLTGDVGAIGGVIFSFQPSGAEFAIGLEEAAFTAAFGTELVVSPAPPQQKLIFFGKADTTRIEADGALIKLGGEASNTGFDFYVAAGVQALTAVIDPGDDGLLGALVSDPITISAGDIAAGWRYGRGIYFEGGTNISIRIPVTIELGPLRIHEFGIGLDFGEPFTTKITTTADLTIGPLFAYAEDIGLSISVVPAENGLFGNHDLNFGFVPPTGYAIALNASPIEGGGMLSIGDDEYRGALALKFQKFGFSAFGILNTKLPDDRDGFSFAASIFTDFSVPLGFGFFLTGLGGVIGINRTIDTDALRTVLYEGRLDSILFPDDPIQNAATILDDMAAILPVREGQHLFGPVARIGWGQPVLVDVKLGLVLELGAEYRLLILGGLGTVLPTKEAALVELNLRFFGEIEFATGKISFDATLEKSRVLTYTIGGDVAVRTGWGPRIEQVASFGGLHPQFPKPSNLPDLRRLTINFGTNNPKVTISGYLALTSNSLQFGARADVYAKGPKIWLIGQLAAEGWVALDVLVYFDPFAFDGKLAAGLNLLRNGNTVLQLGADLRLRGPNTFQINGSVWAKVFGKKVRFGINHTWGNRKSIPPPRVDAVAVLREALANSAGFEPVIPSERLAGVGFAETDDIERAVDPIGGVRLVQRAVPLGIRIDKIGEAKVSANANTLDIAVFNDADQRMSLEAARLDFVRGHFFNLTEGEKLRATAFDPYKAGVEFSADTLVGPFDRAIEQDYEYEIFEIKSDQETGTNIRGKLNVKAGFMARFAAANNAVTASPTDRVLHELDVPGKIEINPPAFVIEENAKAAADASAAAAGPRADLVDAGLAGLALTGARHASDDLAISPDHLSETNHVVVDYLAAAQV